MLEKIKAVVNKQNAKDVLDFTRTQILKVATEQLSGEQKKAAVVEQAKTQIMKLVKAIDFPGIDAIWDSIIEKILDAVLPEVVQAIYNALKTPVPIEL